MARNFEGGYYMSQYSAEENEIITAIIAQGDLGPGNIGNIGPSSEREAEQAADLGRPEYSKPAKKESHCMDDRLEIEGIQLAGNRAITEAAGDVMNPEWQEVPLSQNMTANIKRLVEAGYTPGFHPGCAALLLLSNRKALEYMVESANQPLITSLADARLRILGIDALSPNDYEIAYETTAERLAKEELWDATPEELMEIAEANGAIIDDIEPGDHASVATRWDMTENTFDNAAFRHSHTTDEGGPMGALSVTPGAYMKQLEAQGYSQREEDLTILRGVLFQIAVLKVAEADSAPDVIVGNNAVIN
jgi:hypothetical protein